MTLCAPLASIENREKAYNSYFVPCAAVTASIILLRKLNPQPTEEEKQATESALRREIRWQSEADESVKKACAQELTGFNRIIDVWGDHSSSNPKDWKAKVEAEFINKVGGIERTNLPFTFFVSYGHVYASLDLKEVWKRQEKENDKFWQQMGDKYGVSGEEIRTNYGAVLDRESAKSDAILGKDGLPHTWRFIKGGKFEGRYVRSEQGNIMVQGLDGRTFKIPLSDLSDQDKMLMNELSK